MEKDLIVVLVSVGDVFGRQGLAFMTKEEYQKLKEEFDAYNGGRIALVAYTELSVDTAEEVMRWVREESKGLSPLEVVRK